MINKFHFAIGFYWPSGELGFYSFISSEIQYGNIQDALKCLKSAEFHGDKEYHVFRLELNKFTMLDSKVRSDVKLRDFGYADGDYFNTCGQCDEEFIGDKRAQSCKRCAEKNMKEYLEG